MQFHVTIDTTRAASFGLTHGLPYQNLADYEGALELARGSFALAADDLPRRDVNEPVNFFFMQNHGTDGARVAITIREISYV